MCIYNKLQKRQKVARDVPCDEIWSKKLEFPGYATAKPHDPTFINFESIRVTDGQTDRHAAYR